MTLRLFAILALLLCANASPICQYLPCPQNYTKRGCICEPPRRGSSVGSSATSSVTASNVGDLASSGSSARSGVGNGQAVGFGVGISADSNGFAGGAGRGSGFGNGNGQGSGSGFGFGFSSNGNSAKGSGFGSGNGGSSWYQVKKLSVHFSLNKLIVTFFCSAFTYLH